MTPPPASVKRPELAAWQRVRRELSGFNPDLIEARTAKEWGLMPRGWREEPLDDQARMLAYGSFCSTRGAY